MHFTDNSADDIFNFNFTEMSNDFVCLIALWLISENSDENTNVQHLTLKESYELFRCTIQNFINSIQTALPHSIIFASSSTAKQNKDIKSPNKPQTNNRQGNICADHTAL